MTKRYPLAHKIHMPERPYREAVNTDIRATIKAERKRLVSEEVCKAMRTEPLIAEVVPNPNFRRVK